MGLTTYAWLKDSIYGEVGVYRSSPQGFSVNGLAGPDSTAGGVLVGGARIGVSRMSINGVRTHCQPADSVWLHIADANNPSGP